MKESARKSASGGKEARKSPVQIDWPAVERDYRTSQMTLREMGAKHGCDHAAIARRAKRDGWQRDLTEAVKQATNAKLIEASVNKAVTKAVNNEQQAITSTVLAAAEINAQVILGHRSGLSRLARIKEKLLDSIEQTVDNLPDLVEIIEMVRCPDENGMDRANDALKKALGRSAAVDEIKKLTEVDERIRRGEREAFSISSELEEIASKPVKRVVLDFVDVVTK